MTTTTSNHSTSASNDGSSDEPLIAPMCSIFRRFLKRQGLKFTPERATILNAVLAKAGVFEAEQLLYEMRQAGLRVSKATIYRTLKHLLEAKILTEVLLDSKQSHYQLSFGQEHKSHLLCVETGRIVEFTNPQLQAIRDAICKEHGFEAVSFRFVIYGISPEARKAEQAEVATADDTEPTPRT